MTIFQMGDIYVGTRFKIGTSLLGPSSTDFGVIPACMHAPIQEQAFTNVTANPRSLITPELHVHATLAEACVWEEDRDPTGVTCLGGSLSGIHQRGKRCTL